MSTDIILPHHNPKFNPGMPAVSATARLTAATELLEAVTELAELQAAFLRSVTALAKIELAIIDIDQRGQQNE